jgi:hypothetical protein
MFKHPKMPQPPSAEEMYRHYIAEKRDVFAAHALQGLLSAHDPVKAVCNGTPQAISVYCYEFADAMLEARKKLSVDSL